MKLPNKFDPVSLPPLDIPFILRQAGLSPNKKLGQNFLSDPNILMRLITSAEVTKTDRVLEIGSGLGSLTRYLAVSAQTVTAVEIDRKIFPILSTLLANFQNVNLVQGDMLELSPQTLMENAGYLVVANIPYYITSALIRHLLESTCQPSRIVLTVQNEVAQRICAMDGDFSLLALSVQVYGRPEIMFRIPAGAFYPAPTVDSAVVRIHLYKEPVIPSNDLHIFFRLIKAGFSQKRKTLRNSLSSGLKLSPVVTEEWLKQNMIDPMRRAETLALEEWQTLTQAYKILSK